MGRDSANAGSHYSRRMVRVSEVMFGYDINSRMVDEGDGDQRRMRVGDFG